MLDIGIHGIISAIQIVGIGWLIHIGAKKLGYRIKLSITLTPIKRK